jgi:amino acid transporter/nucleotide-binding universal stress UspA family protein
MATARVIVVSSVMFAFISYWRTAAVVLCDLGSTAYYIGGIVEQSVGPAAPWFILAVLLFSYAVRSVYIESCSLFIRGGVYRVVKEALGRFFAKLAVSALIFDYLLTGPISGVSAGQYLMGLALDVLRILNELQVLNEAWIITDPGTRATVKAWGAVVICIAATLYFYRLNVRGIHESSDRALKIMVATTIMVAVILVWCGLTLALQGRALDAQGQPNQVPIQPRFELKEKVDPVSGEKEAQPDPLGFIGRFFPAVAEQFRGPMQWLSLLGVVGMMMAFGHSILAMSGEETLAQVYREVEAPKLPNFRKAAFIVFVYSLVFTAGISFLAVLLIPETERTNIYSENLISGLTMNLIGPDWLKLLLNAFVVVVGFLILSGAVNTAIIGSNGVLNRVAEDGVLPEWFLKPHPRFGTSYRILTTIVALQIIIILLSRGDTLILGEAYAFGVVWSFVFQALSMVVLRFKDPRPREYRVPFNLKIGKIEIPFGLIFVLLVLLCAALLNLLTKELATIFGSVFTATFFTVFLVSEYYHDRKLKGGTYKHLEQFNQQAAEQINAQTLHLTKPYRKLVAIRSTQNLVMLEKTLQDTDPATTDVVVMTAKPLPKGETPDTDHLDAYDQELMTAVVQRAEKSGKVVHPLIVPTNNPLYALLRTASELLAQELVVGASNKFTADEQFDLISFYWIELHGGVAAPLTVRILSKDRDLHFDLSGGSRIPRHVERRARSVAELREAGLGIGRVLLVHEDSSAGLDLYQAVLTMLDPSVTLTLAVVVPSPDASGSTTVAAIRAQAEQLVRKVSLLSIDGDIGAAVVKQAIAGPFDAVIIAMSGESPQGHALRLPDWVETVLRNAPCRVFLVSPPPVPQEPVAD